MKGRKFDKGNKGVSWSQNMYHYLFGRIPYHDISEENSLIFMALLDQFPEQDREYLYKYFGINRPCMTLTTIAKESGFGSITPVQNSIRKSMGCLFCNHGTEVKLLFTPHFAALRNCTRRGNCPWRLNCKVNVAELALNPQKILEVDDLALCETLKAWKASIPPTVFKSPVK